MIGLLVCALLAADPSPVRVGSKAFTESVILGEIATQLLMARGVRAEHQPALGSTAITWAALESGNIQIYPEYTGTLRFETLASERLQDHAALSAALARRGITMTAPLGFENTYGLGMTKERAAALGVQRISDLAREPQVTFGLSNEFLDRDDGWPGLAARYDLSPASIRGVQHDIAYRALADGLIDVTDVYTTDAEIQRYGVRVLEDDRRYFPKYRAVYLCRACPEAARRALDELGGTIDEAAMQALNARVRLDRVSEAEAAADFLSRRGVSAQAPRESAVTRIRRNVVLHLGLVLVSLISAVLVAVPIGVLGAWWPRLGQLVVAFTGVLQTIPSLALLVFMIPLFGIGYLPAVAALFVYSLLPIVQNTVIGLRSIPGTLHDAAASLGLSRWTKLRRIELPLASPSILGGIRTAAVINVGTATLGALIGAGGLGEPILMGIRLNDVGLVLQGAVPAALLAVLTQGAFAWSERWLVPRGLRLRRE